MASCSGSSSRHLDPFFLINPECEMLFLFQEHVDDSSITETNYGIHTWSLDADEPYQVTRPSQLYIQTLFSTPARVARSCHLASQFPSEILSVGGHIGRVTFSCLAHGPTAQSRHHPQVWNGSSDIRRFSEWPSVTPRFFFFGLKVCRRSELQ